jgi:hypothetical protein
LNYSVWADARAGSFLLYFGTEFGDCDVRRYWSSFAMVCYCIFSTKPDAELLVDVQDEFGRSLGDSSGTAVTPHPYEKGFWRLGPFYVPDPTMSEFQAGDIR